MILEELEYVIECLNKEKDEMFLAEKKENPIYLEGYKHAFKMATIMISNYIYLHKKFHKESEE